MHLIRHLNQSSKIAPCALTIGNFDGVHLGHSKIINKVKQIAQEENIISAILTFEPHPVFLFKPQFRRDFRINSLAQKLKIFNDFAVDSAIIAPFNQRFSELSAQDFVKKILLEKLNMKHLVIGYDFIFGKNREGNLQLLQEMAKDYAFKITNIAAHKITTQKHDDSAKIIEQTFSANSSDLAQNFGNISSEIYSSSLIRKLICEGKLSQANQYLGRNFKINGVVSHGQKIGNTIGFPTANLKPKPHIVKPKFGVYKTQIYLPHLQKKFAAIMNFGLRPTVSQSLTGHPLEPLYEIHIFNFDSNLSLYGKKIEVELLDFIREEKKFDSLDALKQQIKIDCIAANSH